MRKSGKRKLMLALAAAMSMGTIVSAYAGPSDGPGSSSVVVAGQSRDQETAGGTVLSGPGAQNIQSPAPSVSMTNPADTAVQADPGVSVDTTAPAASGESSADSTVIPMDPDAASEDPAAAQAVEQNFYPAGPNGIAGVAADGVVMAKTDGVDGQLTNISLKLNGVDGAISYGVYVNNGGYLPWKGDGLPAGGTENSTYVEAIQVAITGEAAKLYNVYYRGVSAYAGQHGWACNEELMGTVDRGDYLTSIEVCLVPKEMGAPGSYERRFFSNHSEYIHIEEGNTTYYVQGTGYTGWVDHDRARYYFQDGRAVIGWNYIDGLKFYFNNNGALIMDVDDIIGKQSTYQLRVNKELNCLTVFAKDGDNGFIIPVKAMLTSVGDDTPLGTFKTPEKYRWRLMVNDTYTQYATRIIAGEGFLFHSITYEKADPKTLFNNGYNNLGVSRSLGCVRLTCANAKWVYDNCKIGTEVVIYEDANVPGPFFKPYQVWIPQDQRWDPTDPACADL